MNQRKGMTCSSYQIRLKPGKIQRTEKNMLSKNRGGCSEVHGDDRKT